MQLHTVIMEGGPVPFLRMFPMWSSSSRLLDGLFRIVQALPRGLPFSEIYLEVVVRLRELHLECEAAQELAIYKRSMSFLDK